MFTWVRRSRFVNNSHKFEILTMHINKIIFIIICFLLLPVYAFAIESDEDFGAIPNDGLDDSAIQSAIDDVVAEGGGAHYFSRRKIERDKYFAFCSDRLHQRRSQGAKTIAVRSSRFRRAHRTSLYAGNLNIFTIEGVIVVGKNVPEGNPQFYDAKYVVFTTFVQHTNIIRSQRVLRARRAVEQTVLYFGNTDAKVVDSQFDGNSGQYPEGAVIMAEDTRGLTVKRSRLYRLCELLRRLSFQNDSFYGFVDKSQRRTAARRKRNAARRGRRLLWRRRGNRRQHRKCSVGLSDGKQRQCKRCFIGQGIYLKDVEHAKIEQSWFGYTAQARPALDLTNVKAVEVVSLKFGGGVYFGKNKMSWARKSVRFLRSGVLYESIFWNRRKNSP